MKSGLCANYDARLVLSPAPSESGGRRHLFQQVLVTENQPGFVDDQIGIESGGWPKIREAQPPGPLPIVALA